MATMKKKFVPKKMGIEAYKAMEEQRRKYEKMYRPMEDQFCGVTYETVMAMKVLFRELGLEPTEANVEVIRDFLKEAKV